MLISKSLKIRDLKWQCVDKWLSGQCTYTSKAFHQAPGFNPQSRCQKDFPFKKRYFGSQSSTHNLTFIRPPKRQGSVFQRVNQFTENSFQLLYQRIFG